MSGFRGSDSLLSRVEAGTRWERGRRVRLGPQARGAKRRSCVPDEKEPYAAVVEVLSSREGA
jgi:hypothetical protein